jgi:hypothetical protein
MDNFAMKRTESPLGLCPHIDTNPITGRKGCFGVIGEAVMELPTGTAEMHFDIVVETLITASVELWEHLSMLKM